MSRSLTASRRSASDAAEPARRRRYVESRSLENPNVNLSDPDSWGDAFGGSESEAGERVTVDKALTLAAFFQCVVMISGDCAKIPLAPYRRLDDARGKERDSKHAMFRLVHLSGRPNEDTYAFAFWSRIYAEALIWGNGFAWIERADQLDPDSPAIGLYHLLPDRTMSFRRSDGTLWYVTEIGGQRTILRFDEVLHIKRTSVASCSGLSLLDAAKNAIGKALAKEGFESRFFKHNATPGGILIVPAGSDPQGVKNMEEGVAKRYYSRENAFKTMVLRDGSKWEATQVDPEKSMLHELEDDHVRQVARFFNCPAGKIGAKGSTSYASREVDEASYADSTLTPWLLGAAGECNLKLLTPREFAEGMHFAHEINALLWADAKTRSEIANAGIINGRFTVDETRAWEGLPPLPNGLGSKAFWPLNVRIAGEPLPKATTPGLPAPQDPPPAKNADEEDDSEPDEERSGQTIAVRWLREAFDRSRSRLDNVCSRARSIGERRTIAGELEAKHREALVAMYRDAAEACRSAGLARDACAMVDELLGAYRRGLESSAGATIDVSLTDFQSRFLALESATP